MKGFISGSEMRKYHCEGHTRKVKPPGADCCTVFRLHSSILGDEGD